MNPVPLERKVSEQKTSIEALASPKLKPATSGLAAFRLDGDFPVTGVSNAVDEARFQREVENKLISEINPEKKAFDLGDVLPFIRKGAEVIVQDDFSRCFESAESQPWNWNTYLMLLWIIGVLFRYLILFPIRLLSLVGGFVLFGMILAIVQATVKDPKKKAGLERKLIRLICSVFVFSWTGVIKYHGTIPPKKPNQIYVANHTSMIDMIILEQMNTFSVVGQKHPGWIGWLQTRVLGCLGCVWFNRGEDKDRVQTSSRIKEHIQNPNSNRLLVFPEGTCVNNQYCVQFKKGVFEMGAEICPIAIKYNKIFVDAFWNSRAQSFAMHLASLMSSWAVVCDVWYLEPQRLQEGESPIEFSDRVKKMIADRAQLTNVEWDGYLKHFRPSARYVTERQKVFAEALSKRLS